MPAPPGSIPGHHPGTRLFILTTLMSLPGPDSAGSVMIPRIDECVFPYLRLPPFDQMVDQLRQGQELYFWIYVNGRPKLPTAFMRIVCEDKEDRRAQLSFNFLGKGWKKDDDVPALEQEAWSSTVRILLEVMRFDMLVTGVLDANDAVARNLKQLGFRQNAEDNFLEIAVDGADAKVLEQPAVAANVVERDGKKYLRIAVFQLARTAYEAAKGAPPPPPEAK